MKTFYIIDENNNDVCCLVVARNEKAALNKYRKGLLTTGIYEIKPSFNHGYKLISSFGSCFTAVICNYPEQILKSRYLVTIK